MPPIAEATTEEACVRFHGRNVETWEKRGVSANGRFNYWHTPNDLMDWVPRIRQPEEMRRRVDSLFNTTTPAKAQ